MFWQTNLFLSQNIKKTKFTLFHQNYLTSFHSKDSCCRHVALGPPNALHYSFNKFTKIAHTHTYHHIGSCIMTENGFSIFFFFFKFHCSFYSLSVLFLSRIHLSRLIVIIIVTPHSSFVYICRKGRMKGYTKDVIFLSVFVPFCFDSHSSVIYCTKSKDEPKKIPRSTVSLCIQYEERETFGFS